MFFKQMRRMDSQEIQDSPSWKVLHDFFMQSPPRQISKEIKRCIRNPIAKLIAYSMAFLAVVEMLFAVGMCFLVAYGQSDDGWLPAVALIAFPLLMGVVNVVASRFAFAKIREYQSLFDNGRLVKGIVTDVWQAVSHGGVKAYSKVSLKVDGAPGTVKVHDYVDQNCVDYYLNARDSGEPVDLICSDDMLGRCILLAKLVQENRKIRYD